jgi:serine/threonine protein kinase/Flp pilus assembly protein TadD
MILEKIAEGGMGTVYKAEDTKLKRTVALKFISRQAVQDHQTRTRFIQEAQAAARLNHPNINTVYEIEEIDGRIFIAMEFIEGKNLKETIRSEPLTLGETLDIAIQVASGLEEAHEQGFVHRDIKSSNIMITPKGQAKVMDFGLVKMLHGTQITRTAMVMGTVAYMSPEQAGGGEVDQRSDIWSLGVLLYEMASRKLPFGEGDSMVILYSILNKAPKPLGEIRADLPADLERIISRCLKKNQDARYQSVTELKDDLKKLRQALSTGEARPYTSTNRLLQQVLRPFHRPSVAIPAAVILFLLMLILPFRHTWISLLSLGSAGPPEKGLAVLPFNVIGGSEEDQRFCQGLYEMLNSKLTQLQRGKSDLWLVPSVEIIDKDIQSASDAREIFNVDLVIAPNIDYTLDGVNVTLSLIDANILRSLDSRSLSYPSPDRLALRDEIIGEVAALLDIQVSLQDQVSFAAAVSENAEASLFYTRGIGYLQEYQDLDSLDNAVILLTKAIEEDQNFALASAKLGETYWRRWVEAKDSNDLIQARALCKRALELDNNLAAVHITIGIINRETGDLEGAIHAFEKAFELDPDNPDAHREIASAYRDANDLEKAERHYLKAIELNPAFWGGYSHIGAFYANTGRQADAEHMFIKVTELAPDNVRGFNNLGGVYYIFGRLALAESTFQRSLAIKPNSKAYSNLATLYFGQQRYDEATDMFVQAIDLEEGDHRLWGNLGDSRRYTEDASEAEIAKAYERAIGLARRDLGINPQDTETRAYLAFYLAATGDKSHSLDEISQMRKGEIKNVTALRLCVRAYEIIGMRDKALEMLKIYLDNGGSLDEIETNPDLLDMRNDTRYKELIKSAQE